MKTSTRRAHQKLLNVQKKIYRSLKAEVDPLMGDVPPSIKKYQNEYQREFRGAIKRFQVVKKQILVRAIRSSDVSFIADFHTFAQAQKTALRLIREVVHPGENWMIGLELVPSRYQKTLDDFQKGVITLKEFHKIIQYPNEWGFPWAHYAPLFEWAKVHRVPLVALNEPREFLYRSSSTENWFKNRRDHQELHERDRWAAGIITDLFRAKQKQKKLKMIVIYGELHISRSHLPSQLDKLSKILLTRPLKTLSVHQNNDELFWALAKKHKIHQAEVIKISQTSYCVLSSAPWVKLQSILSWAEEGVAHSDPQDEAEPDYLGHYSTYSAAIAEFFALSPPSLESVHLVTVQEADFLPKIKRGYGFTSEELKLIQFHIDNNLRIFVPRAHFAYAGSPTQNRLAELSSLHLLRTHTGSKIVFNHETDDFYRQVIESVFGFFGSLIINPRRKCDYLEDHEKRLRRLARGNKPSFPFEYEARKLTYDLLSRETELLKGRKISVRIQEFMANRSHAPAAMMAARDLGRVLAKRLHSAVFEGRVDAKMIREICLARPTKATRGYEKRFILLLNAAHTSQVALSKSAHL